jgi:undecaprenyl-diphosphatase
MVASVFAVLAVIGMFIAMIRTNTGVVTIDTEITHWAAAHATATSIQLLSFVTHAGDAVVIIVVIVLLIAYATRRPDRWRVILFLLLVVAGQFLLYSVLKIAVGRVRPDVPPFDVFSGRAFPSGHATASAAVWASVAFVVGRGRARWLRAVLAGAAVGLAVAVACSRVFIGAHWTSDVIGGLILGWAWFGLVRVLLGGRFSRSHVPEPAEPRISHIR